jgi:GntR family transcriptional regulator
LQREGIIENKRGIGYFVSTGAEKIIMEGRKQEFFDTTLPEIIKQIKLLQLTKDELKDLMDAIK